MAAIENVVHTTSMKSTRFLDEMEHFVSEFKQRRIKLGLTQAEVGRVVSSSLIYSQTTISRFEHRLLSLKNMHRLKNVLAKWLNNSSEEAPSSQRQTHSGTKTKRRRTTIGRLTKQLMEQHFAVESSPSSATLATLSKEWRLDYEVVRVWFCNRRQKLRRDRLDENFFVPEAVFLDPRQPSADDEVPNPSTSTVVLVDDSLPSSCDPYPLEQLCGSVELFPCH